MTTSKTCRTSSISSLVLFFLFRTFFLWLLSHKHSKQPRSWAQRVPISQIYKVIKSLNFTETIAYFVSVSMLSRDEKRQNRHELENWTICATQLLRNRENVYYLVFYCIYMQHAFDIFWECLKTENINDKIDEIWWDQDCLEKIEN